MVLFRVILFAMNFLSDIDLDEDARLNQVLFQPKESVINRAPLSATICRAATDQI
jgi:hypothetical protein